MVSGWFSLRQDVDFPHFVYMAFVYLLVDLDGIQSVACHVHIEVKDMKVVHIPSWFVFLVSVS